MRSCTKVRALAALVLAVALLPTIGLAEDGDVEPADGAGPDTRSTKDYAPFPNPGPGYVTDLAGLLTDEQEERIERWLWQVESRTRVEIIVVTIDSIKDYPDAPNQSIESSATGLFDAYGIGNMPKNDGVLLLVARDDRKARIELGASYGRTKDQAANRIMQKKIIPYFKKDQYAEGITSGVKAIMREFAHVRVGIHWPLLIAILAVPLLIAIIVSLFRNGKRGWGWVAVGVLIILILVIVRILVTLARHAPRGSSGGWRSGGIGGFGGGFSGGGGATGSW